jgi:prolyl-tRNA synthetase
LGLTFNGCSEQVSGCFSLSINRTIYAVAERMIRDQHRSWPAAMAPFACHIVLASSKPPALMLNLAMELDERLRPLRVACLIDDRPIGTGRKLYDADLLRLPVRVIIRNRNESAQFVGMRLDGVPERSIPFSDCASVLERHFSDIKLRV